MVTQTQTPSSATAVGLTPTPTPLPVAGAVEAPAQAQVQPAADGAARTRDASGRFVPAATAAAAPAPETQAVATSEAAKPAAPARVEDTAEFKALQAAKDREVAQVKRELDQARAERAEVDRQRTIESAAQQGEAETRAQLIAEGYTEEQADKVAKRSTALFKEEVRLRAADARIQSWAKTQIAAQIAQEHGLPNPTMLIGLPTEAAMIAMAKDYGQKIKDSTELVALRAENALLKQGKVPNGTDPSQQFSNGTFIPGGMNDQTWLTTEYSTGRSTDHARARRIRDAQIAASR